MAFFKRNDSIMDVIRCDETEYLIWKWQPGGGQAADFNRANAIRWGSSLRVKEGMVAVFVYPQSDGSAQDYIEGPCDEVIETKNFPVLAGLAEKLYGGGSPFQAEIYFINCIDLLQISFGIPYFDIFDPRFEDYGVPTAVRGTIHFCIRDYKAFIGKHSLQNLTIAAFQSKIKDKAASYIKEIVANAPKDFGIPAIQIERYMSEINEKAKEVLALKFSQEFAVELSSVDIAAIEIDKTGNGYKKLEKLTQNKVADFAHAATSLVGTIGIHRVGGKKKDPAGALSNVIGGLSKNSKDTPPPIPITKYHVVINDEQKGPFGMDELANMVKEGKISGETFVWKEGMKKWERAAEIKELAPILSKA